MLYGIGQSSYGILGMGNNEAIYFLETLKDRVLQEKYIYRHKYHAAVWDTFQTLHSGRQIGIATCEEDSRTLWRISIRGQPAIYSLKSKQQ